VKDLDALEEQHREEELAETRRLLRDHPRPLRLERPDGGTLATSERWLRRLYENERVVREKKPLVVDHLRSAGPWLVSVDEPPMSVLDGMSQTATLPLGFAAPPVVRAYEEGRFGDTLVTATDTSFGEHPERDRFADLLRAAVPGLPHVSFTSSGAEANEKALALCHREHPGRRRVVAFEGSFHGRTLLSLHASWNPAKRAPYELPGFEVSFAPFPVWSDPGDEPDDHGLALADREKLETLGAGDDLLASEARALLAVDALLSEGDVFAVLVEPMQAEGGERYATARFFRALRLLTRRHDVPLVLDEVQAGFGLGGTFAWHARFDLPEPPDCVTFAKRAQVGVVMSIFPDPEPTSAHRASLVRGRVHAEFVPSLEEDDSDDQSPETRSGGRPADVLEGYVATRLGELAARFPDLVLHPRVTAHALAFDLPTPKHRAAYLAQRWWRGAVVFGAGERTVRYRLNGAFVERTVDVVFDAIRGTLKWLEANLDAHGDGPEPPAWQDVAEVRKPKKKRPHAPRVRVAPPEEAESLLDAVVDLETRVYEPARRDPREKLGLAFTDPAGVAIVAEVEIDGAWKVIGTALGAPLERIHGVPGIESDPMRGRGNTIYALSTTLDPEWRGYGLGFRMKRALVEASGTIKRSDGTPRYRWFSGRMRVGATAAMRHINGRLGATEVIRLQNQYEGNAEAVYYRQPVAALLVDPDFREPPPEDPPVPLADLAAPLLEPPETLVQLERRGGLYGPAVNKLTLVNYVTPAIVRALEYVAALAPQPHLFLTSSRDELLDKALRVRKHHRPEARIAIGFEGGYLGHTTAAARSLSDPAVHDQGPSYFTDFLRVPHPADDLDASLAALRDLDTLHGDTLLGLFAEAVQERTGRVIPDAFFEEAAKLRMPFTLFETTSATYRSGRGPFFASTLGERCPSVVAWWGGGQVGFLHCADDAWVPKPLTMVSTWDGDELSLLRVHHQLRAARALELDVAAIDAAMQPLRDAGVAVQGVGAYRVAMLGARAPKFAEDLRTRGFVTRAYRNGAVPFALPLDLEIDRVEGLGRALASLL